MGKVTAFFRKFQYNSPVILSFTLLSFIVYLLSLVTVRADGASSSTLFLFSVYRSSLTDPLTYVRIFGHVLGHANLTHFLNNFILILLVGPMLEEKYGSKNMVFMILFTAAVTGVIYMVFFPRMGLLGASGVVFMLILLSSFVNIRKGKIPVTLLLCIVVFIGKEVVSGITITDNIANLAHIIGGLCGAVFGYLLNKKKFDVEPSAK